MTTTSVAVIAFNRPELAARLIDALRRVRPPQLFLICDGPRPDHPDDPRRTAAVRAELERIDWPAQVHWRAAEHNLGCGANVEGGLDWVFGQVERAIVLEDDCIPDPTFFPYCEELLDRYRDDPRVWQIAGNSLEVPAALFGGDGTDSYAFSSWAGVWGWATWADRWQRHRARTGPARPRPGTLVTRAAQRHFAEAATSEDAITHGWDKHWWLSILTEGGLAATPAVNLVANVGFGADATHARAERTLPPAAPMPFPLRHPAAVECNRAVERELELLLNRVGGRAARTLRRLVRSPRLRAILRRVGYSRAAATVSRKLARDS